MILVHSMAAWKCVVEINDNKAQFAIDAPKPHAMVCTDLEVQRLVRESCYCQGAVLRYLGMLRWTIAMDDCIVGSVRVCQENGGD